MKLLQGEVFVPLFRRVEIKDAVVNIKDGDSNSVSVKLGDGNMSYTERRNIEYILDRGLLDDVREGDQSPVQVQFDATWEYVKGPSVASTVTSGATTGTPTIEDALKGRGGAALWVSTDADTCRPYAVDLEIIINPQPGGCGDQETILLSDFRWEENAHDLRGGTFNISGQCNITEATVTRVAGS